MENKYLNPYRLFFGSITPNWILCRTEISSTAKLVYARLCQYAGKNGIAFPCKNTLAAEVGTSKTHIDKCIRVLKDLKLVEVRERTIEGQPNRSNEYRFLDHPWIWEWDDCQDKSEVSDQVDTQIPAVAIKSRKTSIKPPILPPSPYQGKGSPLTPVSPSPHPGEYIRESGEENHRKESTQRGDPSDTPSSTSTGEEIHTPDPLDLKIEKKIPPKDELYGDKDFVQSEIERATSLSRLKRAESVIESAESKTESARQDRLRKQKTRISKGVSINAKAKFESELGESQDPAPSKVGVMKLWKVWEDLMIQHYPEVAALQPSGKEKGNLGTLLSRYPDSHKIVQVLTYAVLNWSALVKGMIKRPEPCPSLGLITAYESSLLPRALLWSKHRDVLDKYGEFNENDRPFEVEERYLESVAELKKSGVYF